MDIKLTQSSSCCFCLPLRTGLLVLGYINLISHGMLCMAIFFLAFMSLGIGSVFPSLEWALLLPAVLGCELVLNIIVVVATHTKNVMLLKVALYVGTVLWIFTVLYSICLIYRFGISISMAAVILDPIVLGYVLLLVQSFKSVIQAEAPGLQYSDLNRNREARADYERFEA